MWRFSRRRECVWDIWSWWRWLRRRSGRQWVEWVEISPRYERERRSQQHNEVNTFGAWRLAALGSGVTLRYTGDLSVRWEKAHGNRGLLRRVTGVSIQKVGWVRRLETLRAGGTGRVLLRQVYFFDLFWGVTCLWAEKCALRPPHPPPFGGPPFRSPRNGPPFVGYADIFPRYRGGIGLEGKA